MPASTARCLAPLAARLQPISLLAARSLLSLATACAAARITSMSVSGPLDDRLEHRQRSGIAEGTHRFQQPHSPGEPGAVVETTSRFGVQCDLLEHGPQRIAAHAFEDGTDGSETTTLVPVQLGEFDAQAGNPREHAGIARLGHRDVVYQLRARRGGDGARLHDGAARKSLSRRQGETSADRCRDEGLFHSPLSHHLVLAGTARVALVPQ